MKHSEIGIFGLGVMGSALAKNLIEHGYFVSVYSVSKKERDSFEFKGQYQVAEDLHQFTESIKKPRIIIMMITAGTPVDEASHALLPFLGKGDILIDGGNSYYQDTNRRMRYFEKQGIDFVGMGISGGEKGARKAPCIMFGGKRESWKLCENILTDISAVFQGEPCCGYISEGGAGHYVKMVHNGIEYGVMQLLSESYAYMKQVLDMENDEIAQEVEKWNCGELNSYLLGIMAVVLKKKEEDGTFLLDKIKGTAKQKGTGKWVVQEAIERKVYVPSIFEAVSARNLSTNPALYHGKLHRGVQRSKEERTGNKEALKILENAVYVSVICCYLQGISMIGAASEEFGWNICIEEVLRIWRNGCIIRAALLQELVKYRDNFFSILEEESVKTKINSLRELVICAISKGISMPAFISAVSYVDQYSTGERPMALIQGLRDCFGAHTYERNDREGIFCTEWESR